MHFTHFEHINCYPRQGADELADSQAAITVATVPQCQELCIRHRECSAFVVRHHHFANGEDRSIDCWLRKNVRLSSCIRNGRFHLHLSATSSAAAAAAAAAAAPMSKTRFTRRGTPRESKRPRFTAEALNSERVPYNLSAINFSAASWDQQRRRRHELQAVQERRHQRAKQQCAWQVQGSVTSTGGFCLATSGLVHVALPRGQSYLLPDGSYLPADGRILLHLSALLTARAPSQDRLSLIELGAGVGQMGHGLRAIDPHVRWSGFDGAGNVEEVTRGHVRFSDLSLPLAVPRRFDWVACLEVAEHVPRALEGALVRNLHALACHGILLSWGYRAYLGGRSRELKGHHHVNTRSNQYVVSLFERLGYVFDAAASAHLRRGREATAEGGKDRTQEPSERELVERHGFPANATRNHAWFGRTVFVFQRRVPLHGAGCTRLSADAPTSFPMLPHAPSRSLLAKGVPPAQQFRFQGGLLQAHET